MSAPILCKNCAPAPDLSAVAHGAKAEGTDGTNGMTNTARPWTVHYPPGVSPDLGPLKYPHMAAAIRDASATYAKQPAFTLALPNGSQGGITFEETDRLSDQFAVYLREVAGFKAGDRVAIQMPNCLAYPVAVFGTLKAGLVMANTNPLYTTAEMTHQFTDSGAVGLIVIDLFATKVAEVLPKTSIKTVSSSAFRICCRRSSA